MTVVWPARPSHLNAMGDEWEGQSSGSTISSHLWVINLTFLCTEIMAYAMARLAQLGLFSLSVEIEL